MQILRAEANDVAMMSLRPSLQYLDNDYTQASNGLLLYAKYSLFFNKRCVGLDFPTCDIQNRQLIVGSAPLIC